jgi:hypothetical protein
MKRLLFLLSISAVNFLFCQALPIQWERSYGGPGNEEVECLRQTSDGGYIFCGYCSGNGGDVSGAKGGMDFWVVKFTATGSIQWQKPMGGTQTDRAKSIIQTSDGGYIVAGSTSSNNFDVTVQKGNGDYWVVKLDNLGNIQWQKTYGGSAQDGASSIIQTTDGNYLVGGISTSTNGDITVSKGGGDIWLLKIDNTGTILWQKSYGGSNNEAIGSILETSDGAYAIGGVSYSTDGDVVGPKGGGDFWLLKVAANNGVILKQYAYGGTTSDAMWSVKQTADKGFIMAGHTFSSDGDVTNAKGQADSWIVKADSLGVLQWQSDVGGSQGDYFYSVAQTSDGGYIACGTTWSNDGDIVGLHDSIANFEDVHIVKYNSTGAIQWKKCYGGTASDWANSIIQSTDGGYIFGGLGQSYDGDVSHAATGGGAWVVKLSSTNSVPKLFDLENEILVFPNPAHSILNFNCPFASQKQVKITNVIGKTVHEQMLNTENSTLDISSFAAGVYFYCISENSGLIQTGKIVVE